IGLCPEWKNGDVHTNERCMTGVAACMMAHVNTAGIHVPVWLDNNSQLSNGSYPINWGVDRVNYPMQEGTFFGDIIDTGSLSNIGLGGATGPAAFYCDGAGFPAGAAGVVAGRLGASQSGAPYKNPFGNGVMCQNASTTAKYSNGTNGSCPAGSYANPSVGCPDGYDTLTTSAGPWKNAVTVWRNNNYTPVFDTSYIYRISPLPTNGGQSLDVVGGSTAIGTTVQQYTSWDGVPQKFTLVPDGGNWRIAMTVDLSKCVDLAGSGSATGNGTQLKIASCTAGDPSQTWTVTPDAMTGAFYFKNVQSGRCLDETGKNTAAGVALEIWDCNGGANQKWNINAYPSN
ncbi:MAG TPA: RICIN domain-containing protein, partial [Polyangia bacterium]|nr:RICIN domain-containing protein [Polyangia bacterium]